MSYDESKISQTYQKHDDFENWQLKNENHFFWVFFLVFRKTETKNDNEQILSFQIFN